MDVLYLKEVPQCKDDLQFSVTTELIPTAVKTVLVFSFFNLTGRWVTGRILSGLYLRNHEVQEVDTWWGHWVGGSKCAMSWCNLDLTFYLALVVTLTFKILS